MAGSTMGPDMPPHPHAPYYHPGNEGGPPNSFPAGRRHGWQGYFGHPDRRGQYSWEVPEMSPQARAASSTAPPPPQPQSAPSTEQQPIVPVTADPPADIDRSGGPHCGRRRGWWRWGSSTPTQATGPDGCTASADQSPPGTETWAGQQGGVPGRGRHGGCAFSGRGGAGEMGRRGQAGGDVDPRQWGPFPADGTGRPSFPADPRGFPGVPGDHTGFPGSESGGPPFRGDYSRFGPFRYGYGYPPFHGYRYPGFYGASPFESGPESRYIFREFDFQ